MVMYHFDNVHPALFKYVLVSIGSSFLVVVFLLMCGKKDKKEKTGSTVNVNGYPPPSPGLENVTLDIAEDEAVVVKEAPELQSEPPDLAVEPTTSMSLPPSSSVHSHQPQPYDPVIKPSTPQLTSTTADHPLDSKGPAEIRENSCSDSTNPYASVRTKNAVVLPVYEHSGNSENSGNSLYAKVQDVAQKEETAYAVVDIKDKDYDFVNGELVRRKVEDEVETDSSSQTEHYDTPVSPPVRKSLQVEEIENSGASGIYEIVPSVPEGQSITNTTSGVSASDIYEACGSGIVSLNTTPPPAAPPRDSPQELLSVEESVITRRGSSKEKLNDKFEKNEKHEHEEGKHRGLFKSLKFGHSKKSKRGAEETQGVVSTAEVISPTSVDVGVEGSVGEDGGPPPPPSVDKLITISAHRKGQHSGSDINPFPDGATSDSSPSESPTVLQPPPFSGAGHDSASNANPLHHHSHPHHNIDPSHPPPPPLRPRMSEADINTHEVPHTLTKTNSLPESNSDDIALSKYSEHMSTDNPNTFDLDTSVASLLSEPDYAEITNSEPTMRVKESSFDNLLPGYTSINYGDHGISTTLQEDNSKVTMVNEDKVDSPTYKISCEPTRPLLNDTNDDDADYDEVCEHTDYEVLPGAEVVSGRQMSDKCTNLDSDDIPGMEYGGSSVKSSTYLYGFTAADEEVRISVDSDYASIDFGAREEERKIKDLYAAIDFSSKKSRDDDVVETGTCRPGAMSPSAMYEGTYNIIPERGRTSLKVGDSSLLPQSSDTDVMASPLYEEVPQHLQK